MARYQFVVITQPHAGQEKEFNDWYTNRHLDDVIAVDGFISAQRFEILDDTNNRHSGKYLAIYEMETDDAAACVQKLTAMANAGTMYVSPAMDMGAWVTHLVKPITERKARK
jgi:hypothetical protein